MREASTKRRHPERSEVSALRFTAVQFLSALFVLVLTFQCVAYGQKQRPANDFLFPTAKGTYWIYAGTERSTEPGSNRVESGKLRWRVEVLDYFQREGLAVLLMKGAPWDPSSVMNAGWEHMVVRLNDTYYFVKRGQTFFDELKTMPLTEAGAKLQEEYKVHFRVPLRPRTGICDSNMKPDACENRCYKEGRYCWFVQDRQEVRLQFEGAPKPAAQQFSLIYRTNPDHTLLKLVPGLGITDYEYVHHGTIDEQHARLVEFHPVEAK